MRVKLDLSPFRLNKNTGRVSCEPLLDRDQWFFERWWWESEIDEDNGKSIAIVQFVDDWRVHNMTIYMDVCELGGRVANALYKENR